MNWFETVALAKLQQRNLIQVDYFHNLIQQYNDLLHSTKILKQQLKSLETQAITCQSLEEDSQYKQKVHELQEELAVLYKKEADVATTNLQSLTQVKTLTEEKEQLETKILTMAQQLNKQHQKQTQLEHENKILLEELKRIQAILLKTEEQNQQLAKENQQLIEKHLSEKLNIMEELNQMNEAVETTKNTTVRKTSSIEVLPIAVANSIKAHATEINDACCNVNGTMIFTASSDSTIRGWDIYTGQVRTDYRIQNGQALMSLDLLNETDLLLGTSSDRTCRIWTVSTGRLRHTFTGHVGKVLIGMFHQTNQVITGSSDRTIKLWDLHRGYCSLTLNCRSSCHSLSSTLGNAMVCSGHLDGNIRLWDGRTSGNHSMVHELANLHEKQAITCVEYLKDDNYIISNGKDNRIQMIDSRTYQIVQTFTNEDYRTTCNWSKIKTSPNSQYVAAGSFNGSVFIWNTTTGTLEKHFDHDHSCSVISCTWNHNGTKLASCDKNGYLLLWE